MKIIVSFLIVLIVSPLLLGMSANPVGSIKPLEGKVYILRHGRETPARAGHAVFQHDIIRTGENGRLGIILRDDTTISLGPNSVLELKDYVFQPKDGKFSFVVRMLKGTFVYLSGVMGKLAPDAIKIETPESTIGIRGTKLLIKVEEP